ncbi:hypothetical protein Fmac_008746 [Flemingia macrophylla]|uniref:SHSP domain-containing protein n=1 Tax=Flemingia macrophylla TaxID=520843 RepID=A0ABD1MY99_9FABA
MATETGRNTSEPVVEEIVPSSAWTEDHAHHILLVDLPEFTKEEVQLQVDVASGRIIVKGERQTDEHKRVHFDLTFPLPVDSYMDNISGNFDRETEILYVNVPKRTSQEKHRESKAPQNLFVTPASAFFSPDHSYNSSEIANVKRQQEIESDHEEHNEKRDHYPHNWDREKKEIKNECAPCMEDLSGGLITSKLGQKHNSSRALMKVLMRNKGVVGTAVIAFAFGLYVSHKFHSWNSP